LWILWSEDLITIGLIVVGAAVIVLALSNTFSAGRDMDKWRNFLGLILAIAACTCFYIAGTMA
jgi:hypothetical protein